MDKQDDKRSRRRRGQAVAWAALLAAGILAAWQIHIYWQRPRRADGQAKTAYRPEGVKAGPQVKRRKPGDVAKNPMDGVGPRFLTEDPGELEPPPGATFRHGMERVEDGCLYRHLRYGYRGAADEAARHYERILKAQGLSVPQRAALLGDKIEKIVVFESAGESVTVQVYQRKAKARERTMTVSIMRLIRRPKSR